MSEVADNITALIEQKSWLHPSGGPRYIQLRRHLERAITQGVLEPDTPLPSEREMALIAGLSRVTIRKAVEDLVRNKLIVQRRGSGTFVAPKVQKLEHSLSRLTSFTEDMQRRGKSSDSEIILAGIYSPSPEEIVALGLHSGDMVARIERLRRADGVPVAIERSSISSNILPHPEDVSISLYDVLDELDMRPVRAIQRISATKLTPDQAKLLQVKNDDPALKIVRTGYLASGRVIEFTTGTYRGDAYDFVAELQT